MIVGQCDCEYMCVNIGDKVETEGDIGYENGLNGSHITGGKPKLDHGGLHILGMPMLGQGLQTLD